MTATDIMERIKTAADKGRSATGNDTDNTASVWRPPMTLISKKQLLQMIPLSDRGIYKLEQDGKFPKRIALSSRSVAWILEEVEAWIRERRDSGERALYPGERAR